TKNGVAGLKVNIDAASTINNNVLAIASPSLSSSSTNSSASSSSTTTASEPFSFFDNLETKKVRVYDIDIAYKIFGKGKPLILIPGFSMTMDMWDPNMLNGLSSNHTIIIFDNRGVGETTAGNNIKKFSIQQFANDTAGLLAALKIDNNKPLDILGASLGGFIAQEFALSYPEKVDTLILYASTCGGNKAILPQISHEAMRSMVSGNASKDLFLSTLFPKEWIKENIEYIEKNFLFPMGKVSTENIQRQSEAATNWNGSCDRLSSITKPTLVITGTEDIISPPENSLMIAGRIPGAWLVQMEGGGHGLMFQYPEKFTRVLETFLSVS
ncbi:MAG: alpha/beta hydrolase, partial [Nitrososphaeraceae archaeon]|nr:alpha/beta hydrolase [Nitrososphaeraceae archaeon]